MNLTLSCMLDALDRLIEICKQLKIHPSEPLTITRILDELISVYIEPECVQPTFLYNHPLALSPLAKDAIDDNVGLIWFYKRLFNTAFLGTKIRCSIRVIYWRKRNSECL